MPIVRLRKIFAISAIFFLWALLFYLFLLAKSDLYFFRQQEWPGRSWIFYASEIVFTGIFLSFLLMILPIIPSGFNVKNIPLSIPLLLLLFSAFPLGFYYKFHTLFYEKWMWIFALQFVGVCLAIAILEYVLSEQPSWLSRIGRLAMPFDDFLRQPNPVPADRWLMMGLSAWVLICTGGLHDRMFGGVPHVYDEISQLFQAQIFSHGLLTAPAPDNPAFFERMYLLIENGRWYSIYPPGHALILALGVLAGGPGWIDPLLSAAILPLFYATARRMGSLYAARWGSILLSLSPFFLIMGGSYMNHPSTLFFLLLSFFFLQKSLNETRWRWGVAMLAGGCAGFVFLIRPLTALAFWAAGILWLGFHPPSSPQSRWILAGCIGVGMLPALLFFLYYNQATTGSPWVTGYAHYFDANPMGFGAKPWGPHPLGPLIPRGEVHTPLRGLANTLNNLNGMNSELFGWPVPSLLLAFTLLFPGMKRRKNDGFCLAVILLVCGVYFFYFFQDNCYGPRFLYATLPFVVLLSARGIEELRENWGKNDSIRSLLYGMIALFFLTALFTSWPDRIAFYKNAYWGTPAEPAHLLETTIHEPNALIFVENPNDHLAIFFFLDPLLKNGWIIAHDLGTKENNTLLRKYPEWPAYRLRPSEEETDFGKSILEHVR